MDIPVNVSIGSCYTNSYARLSLPRSKFPLKPRMVFDVIDEPSQMVPMCLLSYDFDPASEGELLPMAQAFTRHCCVKGA